MKRIVLIHPVLFAAFPILFLYAQNANKMNLVDIAAPLAQACAVAVVLTLAAGLSLRNFYKGALMTTIVATLFFSYGHVVEALPDFRFLISKSTIGPNGIVLPVWCLLLFLGIYRVLKTRKNLQTPTRLLAQLGLLLVLVQVIHGGYTLASREKTESLEQITLDRAEIPKVRPDIYFIITDAYGRADILQEIYGVDNSQFISFLRERGFFVADRSYSNYARTLMSLSATLNLDYIHNLGTFHPDDKDAIRLAPRIYDNRVFTAVRELGYTVVAFQYTGSMYTESMVADVTLPMVDARGEFQNMLLSTTPLPLFLSGKASKAERHRRLVLSKLEKLPNITEAESPKFVFTHIFCPHKPFVFGPDGEPVDHEKTLRTDGSGNFRDQYISGYADQVTYLSKRLQQTITEILDKSPENPPIIILQGDHGPRSGINWYDAYKTNLKEVFGIINAMYLPGYDGAAFYDSISPVNTFRIIFNEYFRTDFDLLSDSSYFSTETRPFDFELITSDMLASTRNALTYLLEQDFNKLSTLDRMILYQKEMVERPLDQCYADGQPLMTFGDGALELADCRLTHVKDYSYFFEAVFIPHDIPDAEYTVELTFYPAESDTAAVRPPGYRQNLFVPDPALESMPEDRPSYTGRAVRLPFTPHKYTVSIIGGGEPGELHPAEERFHFIPAEEPR